METQSYRILIAKSETLESEISLPMLLVDSGLPKLSTYSSSSLETTRALLEMGGIDLVVCQLGLRSRRDLETLNSIAEIAPEVAVVVVASTPDRSLAPWVLDAGAQDCIFEDEVSSVVLQRSVKYAIERKRSEVTQHLFEGYDQATGLLNQTAFQGLLERWLYRARRGGREQFALLAFRVRELEDYFGRFDHQLAEATLRMVARRIRRSARPGDAMAILDDHELILLLPRVDGLRQATNAARRISRWLSRPSRNRGEQVRLTVPWSVTLSSPSFSNAREMLQTAVLELAAAQPNTAVTAERLAS